MRHITSSLPLRYGFFKCLLPNFETLSSTETEILCENVNNMVDCEYARGCKGDTGLPDRETSMPYPLGYRLVVSKFFMSVVINYTSYNVYFIWL